MRSCTLHTSLTPFSPESCLAQSIGNIDDSLWTIPAIEYVATTGNEDLQKVPPTKLTHLYGVEGISKVTLLVDEL